VKFDVKLNVKIVVVVLVVVFVVVLSAVDMAASISLSSCLICPSRIWFGPKSGQLSEQLPQELLSCAVKHHPKEPYLPPSMMQCDPSSASTTPKTHGVSGGEVVYPKTTARGSSRVTQSVPLLGAEALLAFASGSSAGTRSRGRRPRWR